MPEPPRAADFQCRVKKTIEAPWTTVRARALGEGADEPDAYVLVEKDGLPFLRLDLHHPPEEFHAFTAAEMWGEWIVAGFASRVELVSVVSGAHRAIVLWDRRPPEGYHYFGHITIEADMLLITSGSRVFRLGADGAVLWRSAVVGLDGVLVHDIGDGRVRGDGEWDPPGGWMAYELCLETGVLLSGGDPFPSPPPR